MLLRTNWRTWAKNEWVIITFACAYLQLRKWKVECTFHKSHLSITCLQLLAMPGEVLVAVCAHLDPCSIFNLAHAHHYFSGFINDKKIWERVQMHSDWSFTTDTFFAMSQFGNKIENLSLKHSASVQQLPSLPQGILCRMPNLRVLSVESPAFTQRYFVQLLPHLHTLRLLDCQNFDIETLVEALQRLKRSKTLLSLDLSGVPNVTSFNIWEICSLCPNIEQVVSKVVIGDFVAKQCFLDCPNLKKFDYWPLSCMTHKWRQLRTRYPQITFGNRIDESL